MINEKTTVSLGFIVSLGAIFLGGFLWLTSIDSTAKTANNIAKENKADIKVLTKSNAEIITHLKYIVKAVDELKKKER